MAGTELKTNIKSGIVNRKILFIVLIATAVALAACLLLKTDRCVISGRKATSPPNGVTATEHNLSSSFKSGRHHTLPLNAVRESNPIRISPRSGQISNGTSDNRTLTEACKSDWLDELVNKLQLVESHGRSIVSPGDNGLAIGPMQLHPCVIDDLNRNLGTKFTYADRNDLVKSKRMAKLYIAMYLDIHKEEIAARIYNGGPRGWEKESTEKYYAKIRN